jgi:hypothetical protein
MGAVMAKAECFLVHLDLPPGRLCGIGQPDIDRSNPEDGDHNRFLSIGWHAIVVPGAGMAQDVPASHNGHGLMGCEVRAALHPPCSRNHQTDAIGSIISFP